ncbi:MAG TPA: molybdopterin-guanine dinucleotide biosynthesis protein B [Gemmatimonadaceae bacterium]|jgi:molybdopterin-guanine dinucleotide biosynthesis protein MobB|nr:molybdopterin-guanine dinucleotide biosynthesis protein B [Gemmatimonadaceae bacterium]
MVAIIGRKHHGKTTLTVRLAAELHRRGYRVMTIKHGTHTFEIDPETTDTYRHYHEGLAEKVAMSAPDKFALIERWTDPLGPEDIARRYMADADIVLCEGFKQSALPKIEVFRTAAAVHEHAPLYDPASPQASKYLAIVTDTPGIAPGVPEISFATPEWLETVADLVERRVMRRGSESK